MVSNFNSDNGLPQNTVKDIRFDNAGFLWIATENGLMRYDGFLFKLFSSPGTEGLNNRIVRLNSNTENRLFVIDVNGTLAEIGGGRIRDMIRKNYYGSMFTTLSLGSQLPYSLFTKLMNQGFFTGVINSGLEEILPLKNNQYFLIYSDRIVLYDETRLVYELTFPSRQKSGLFKLHEKLIMLDPGLGFFLLDQKNRQWVKLEDDTDIPDYASMSLYWKNHQPHPFLIFRNQLFDLDLVGKSIRARLLIDSLVHKSSITCIEYDSNAHHYLVGTESEGLFLYQKSFFKNLQGAGRNKAYYGQYPLNDQFILTNNGDIVGAGIPPSGSPVKKFNNYIITDPPGNIYYSSGDTVIKYDKVSGNTIPLFNDYGSGMFVLDYLKDTLWMINSNGIYYHTNGKNITSLRFPFNPNNLPYAMARISQSRFIFGNCLGLFVFEPSSTKIDTLLWLPQKCVRTLWKYKDKIFIGTYGDGWKVWDGHKVTNMPLDKKNYLLYAHCFLRDKNNYLWITTNRGLFKFFMPDVEKYLEGKLSSLYSYQFSKDEGLQNTEFNGGCFPCYVQLQNGFTSLPNLGGLVWFKPEETEHNLSGSQILIDLLDADNRTIDLAKEPIVIEHNTKILRMEVSSPFFGNEINEPIEYRTFGVDTNWKLLNRFNPVIRFTTLPAGQYKVELRKPKGFGGAYIYKSVAFTVKPPWYFSALALIIWGILFIILIMGFIRIRLARYRKRQIVLKKLVGEKVAELKVANTIMKENITKLEAYQKELIKRDRNRSLFLKIISHDLIGPLRFMSMLGRQIEKDKDHVDKQYLLESLKDINTSSESLLLLSMDLLNWISYEKGNLTLTYENFNLYPVIKDKLDLFRKQAENKNIELICSCPEVFFIENEKNIIKIIIHNLLSNAIKFTCRGRVEIAARQTNDLFILSVSDTGQGMSAQRINKLLHNNFIQSTVDTENKIGHGLGFLIIRDLIAITKGKINIQSTEGQGTCITIEWPARNGRTGLLNRTEVNRIKPDALY